MQEISPELHIIILAAGEGKRMGSDLPKILQAVGGQPMLAHLLSTASQLSPKNIHVVIGAKADQVKAAFTGQAGINWIIQSDRLGTGHAVKQALPAIPDGAEVLVLYGDHPLIPLADLQAMVASSSQLTLMTMVPNNPKGYGRILRDRNDRIEGIIEHKDATPNQLLIKEVNTGIVAASLALLKLLLDETNNDNAQQEYYLTDIFKLAHQRGIEIQAVVASNEADLQGANNRRQLASLERRYQYHAANKLMDAGAMLADPKRIDVRGEVEIGRDVFFDINVLLQGKVVIGDGVYIGPGVLIKDSEIAAGSKIEAYSVIEQANIGKHCNIGPFARIRPQTQLADEVKVGNFVEVKKSTIGAGSKASHLSYIGDSTVGSKVNIGAGTITCNYDGVNKHQTIIEDEVFVGSDTQLIAPVRIGKGATIGAGSTISKDVVPDSLAVSRTRQSSISNWKRPAPKENK